MTKPAPRPTRKSTPFDYVCPEGTVDFDAVDLAYKKHPGRQKRCLQILEQAIASADLRGGQVLEIGGRENPMRTSLPDFSYTALDLSKTGPNVIVADITSCPQIPDASFDLVISVDVFEHINAPWKAAAEIQRILRPGGVTYHSTLFSWRYHPCPIDYWRYTPEALKFLFSDLEPLHASFDYTERRRNVVGRGNNHMTPDALGGWRENVRVHYAGRRP